MLKRNKQNGTVRVHRWVTEDELLQYAATIASERLATAGPLSSPTDVSEYLFHIIGTSDVEKLYVVLLNVRHYVIDSQVMFTGTIDGCSVHPREIVRYALLKNAAAVVISHHHPSGIAEPSTADISLTSRVRDALALVDIRLLDHLVLAGNTHKYVSLAARGHC